MSRVTNNMMINNFNNNYNKNQANLNKYMNQLSTGKQFTKVSEDSLKATKALQLKTTIEFNERYTENIKDGNGWLAATDQALDDSINTLRKLRDLGVQGATGSITSEDAKQIQSEVDQLQDHLVNIGNTDYGGRYIFNGTRTLDKPYVNGGSNNPDDYYAEGDIS
ncbi:flagellar hook-associated protein FlgL, partial [Halonatronum saccharophilum]